MTEPSAIHQENFRRILTRNISLPLGVGALSAAVFVALIFYLLSVLGGVEQAERAISSANQIAKLGAGGFQFGQFLRITPGIRVGDHRNRRALP